MEEAVHARHSVAEIKHDGMLRASRRRRSKASPATRRRRSMPRKILSTAGCADVETDRSKAVQNRLRVRTGATWRARSARSRSCSPPQTSWFRSRRATSNKRNRGWPTAIPALYCRRTCPN
jgi:hypothetical protein